MIVLPFQERITLSMLEQWTYQLIYCCSCCKEVNGRKCNETPSGKHFADIYKTRLQYHCFRGNLSCLTELEKGTERNRKKEMGVRKFVLITMLASVYLNDLQKPPKVMYHILLIYDWNEFSLVDYTVEEQFQQKNIKQGWESVFFRVW